MRGFRERTALVGHAQDRRCQLAGAGHSRRRRPLTARYDRALIVLTAGIAITIFLAVYLGLASRNSRQLALANRRVLELAQTDILTGLPNRAFFLEQLKDAGSTSAGIAGAFSILMLDLDRFKNVNDSLGHAAGDALLRQVALRLKSALRGTDVLARLGGDEFAIIQAGCHDQRASSIDLASRISKLIAEPFQLPGHQVEIGTSIGIAHGAGARQRPGAAAEKGRPRAVPVEIGGTQLLHALRRSDVRGT